MFPPGHFEGWREEHGRVCAPGCLDMKGGLALIWGVTPILVDTAATTDEVIDQAEQVLLERGLATSGDNVVITMGVPVGSGVQTNTLKVHQMP